MRVLIEHVTSGHFLSHEGTWVAETDQALSFANLLQAIDHCWGERVFDVVFYLKANDPKLDMRLDVFKKRNMGPKGRW